MSHLLINKGVKVKVKEKRKNEKKEFRFFFEKKIFSV
jgi:hypothetical protein